jgi:hypothetical protein
MTTNRIHVLQLTYQPAHKHVTQVNITINRAGPRRTRVRDVWQLNWEGGGVENKPVVVLLRDFHYWQRRAHNSFFQQLRWHTAI